MVVVRIRVRVIKGSKSPGHCGWLLKLQLAGEGHIVVAPLQATQLVIHKFNFINRVPNSCSG